MKITLQATQFIYTPSLNKIDFSNMIGAFKPECLLAVINTTTGKLVYAAASQPTGYGGTFSTTLYPNDTLIYASSNAGQNASDILEILYDDQFYTQPVSGTIGVSGTVDVTGSEVKSYTRDGNGVKILSTVSSLTAEDGLNVNLLNSSFGGEIGNAMPLPFNNSALSIGVNNGGTLYAPAIDPSTSELQVQAKITDSAGLAINNGQQTMSDSLPVVIASDQSAVPVSFPSSTVLNVDVVQSASQDILGVAIGGNRNNQIEVSFNAAPGASLITNTFTGSGSVSITNGHSIYQTGTTASSIARAVSVQTTTYRPAHEIYSAFTAAFLNPQGFCQSRIGLFDANNGFAIGFDGSDFSVFVRTGGSESSVSQGSFNVDTLTGTAGSKFTRGGTPEALNTTKSNLFRIRFAWLGSANIFFEVFSPDGEWILFHNIRQPNSAYDPSIQNPNLPMTLELVKTGGATNSSIATACWGAGTTSAYQPITDTLNDKSLAALTRSVITGVTTGGGGGYVNVKVNPSGALAVENTQSGTASQNIAQYGGVATSLGQKNSGNSVPVVIASDQSNVNTSAPDLYVTGAITNLLGNNLFNAVVGTGSTDASGYKTGAVQIVTAATSGNFTFEHSNDNVNFQVMPVFRADSASPNAVVTAITATASSFIYHFPIKARYIRLRISSALNNNCQAFLRLSQEAWSPIVPNVVNATAANLNATVSGSLTSAGTVTQATAANLNCTAVVAGATLASSAVGDMVSVSTVATGNSGATGISVLNSHAQSFQVTNVITTGTGSIDAVIQESYDAGSNWVDIFHLDRVTGAGTVRQQIPSLKVNGDRVRYAWTVTGTLTTATMSVIRIPRQVTSGNLRRIYNRTLDPTTLGSSTPSLFTEGCEYTDLIVNMAAGGTAPVIQLQGSEDNTNWYNIGTALTATVGSTTALSIADGSVPKFCRATVSTAGAGSALNYVAIKAKGAS